MIPLKCDISNPTRLLNQELKSNLQPVYSVTAEQCTVEAGTSVDCVSFMYLRRGKPRSYGRKDYYGLIGV